MYCDLYLSLFIYVTYTGHISYLILITYVLPVHKLQFFGSPFLNWLGRPPLSFFSDLDSFFDTITN